MIRSLLSKLNLVGIYMIISISNSLIDLFSQVRMDKKTVNYYLKKIIAKPTLVVQSNKPNTFIFPFNSCK